MVLTHPDPTQILHPSVDFENSWNYGILDAIQFKEIS